MLLLGCGGGSPGAGASDGAADSARWDGGIGRVVSFEAPVALPSSPAPATAIAVGDLDRDGKPDVIVASLKVGIETIRNRGGGELERPVTYASTLLFAIFTLGDVDGDGDLDLVSSDNARGRVEVRANDGQGRFGAPRGYDLFGVLNAAVAVDLNRDGRADLAYGNFGAGGVMLSLEDGTFGSLTPLAQVPVNGLAAGDLDGDGWPDLVFVASAVDGVQVVLNLGDGTFAPPVGYATSSVPQDVAIADVDGDGRADVVTASFDDGVSVFLNKGGGELGEAHSFASGSSVQFLALADVDGDGRLDAVTASTPNGRLGVLVGMGNGEFALPVGYRMDFTGMALGDLDGDGRTDIVTATAAGAVLLQNRSH